MISSVLAFHVNFALLVSKERNAVGTNARCYHVLASNWVGAKLHANSLTELWRGSMQRVHIESCVRGFISTLLFARVLCDPSSIS